MSGRKIGALLVEGVEVRPGVTVATTKRTSRLPVVQRGQTYWAEEPLRVAVPPPGTGVTPMMTSFEAACTLTPH